MPEPNTTIEASPSRHSLLRLAFVAVMASVALCSMPATAADGPDVTVYRITEVHNWGSALNGVRAYSVGTTSCNVGTEPLNWCDEPNGAGCAPGATDADHPVIAQNIYRLKNGRFMQIGMSWLKHGFLSTNSFASACQGNHRTSTCIQPPAGGDQLGIGCIDTYGSSLNGHRPLGPRSEVDATTGIYPFPHSVFPTPTVIEQRVQVLESDLDPALNAGARYWVEGHYIASDDAAAGNGLNNASYRKVTVSAPSFGLYVTGSTIREQPAIAAWRATDPAVELINVDVPGAIIQRFHVARKVTELGRGVRHYEYAVHNMNAQRAAWAFRVAFPGGPSITNPGASIVNHHSGEPYSTSSWSHTINGGRITWFTDDFHTDPDANALRWGTMFSFWFDATADPTQATHLLGLFEPGTPSTVAFGFPGALRSSDGFESDDATAWSATTLP